MDSSLPKALGRGPLSWVMRCTLAILGASNSVGDIRGVLYPALQLYTSGHEQRIALRGLYPISET